jgi:class 3 adenylate cyclase
MATATFTLLFTDIAGSTEHVLRLGDARWDSLLGQYRGAVRGALGQFGGSEVDTAGDGFFAVFSDSTAAIGCAQSIATHVDGLGLTSRTGLHVGQCSTGGEKVSGVNVHTAARVMSVARPGEVLLSSAIRESIPSQIGFVDRGTHHLKGLPGNWQLYAATRTC